MLFFEYYTKYKSSSVYFTSYSEVNIFRTSSCTTAFRVYFSGTQFGQQAHASGLAKTTTVLGDSGQTTLVLGDSGQTTLMLGDSPFSLL